MILWLGLGISAFAISGSWLAFTGPVVLIIVMRGVSIPLTDDHMRSSRSGYDDYAARTPSLLPTGSTPSKVAKQNA
jgi:steroid 5-alpha reductase family enzyme